MGRLLGACGLMPLPTKVTHTPGHVSHPDGKIEDGAAERLLPRGQREQYALAEFTMAEPFPICQDADVLHRAASPGATKC